MSAECCLTATHKTEQTQRQAAILKTRFVTGALSNQNIRQIGRQFFHDLLTENRRNTLMTS